MTAILLQIDRAARCVPFSFLLLASWGRRENDTIRAFANYDEHYKADGDNHKIYQQIKIVQDYRDIWQRHAHFVTQASCEIHDACVFYIA